MEALRKINRYTVSFVTVMVMTLTVFLCGCTPKISSVTLDVTQKTAYVGEAFKITATATGEVEWSSDDEEIVMVNALGTVTAVGVGTATVIARCGSSRATCYVIVENDPASARLSLDIASCTVVEGESFTVTATSTLQGAVLWLSSNNSVASVSNGVVTAKKSGTAVITAMLEDLVATCTVTVVKKDEPEKPDNPDNPDKPEPADEVSVDISEKSLNVGQTFKITATANKQGSFAWSSSDPTVATVSGGTVTAAGAGNATITVKFGTARATCSITVIDPEIFDIAMSQNAGVVANAGKWFYWAEGKYELSQCRYNHGVIVFAFNGQDADKNYQLRYQPYSAGVDFTARFTVSVSAAGVVKYGSGGGASVKSVALASGQTKEVVYNGVTQTSVPFVIQINAEDITKPITLTVSNISFALQSTLICDNYSDSFSVGVAVQNSAFKNYSEQVKNFNSFTPENDMKWKFLEPTEGKVSYTNADAITANAAAMNAGVRGHCLVWYKSLPDWLTAKAVDKASALAYMNKHIEDTMKHFGNKVYAWDVCNEALRNAVSSTQLDSGDIYRTGASEAVGAAGTVDWYKLCGVDYIKQAFAKSGEVRTSLGLTAEDLKLYYNDYSLNDPNKRAACVQLVKTLQSENIPIDGVGMQAHYRLSSYTANKQVFLSDFEESIKAFTELGIDVQITELDIRVYSKDGDGAMSDEELEAAFVEQGEMYGEIFKICKKYAAPWKNGAGRVTNLTTWGVSDRGTAWDTSAHKEHPFIFDTDGKAKPAINAILAAAK